MRLLRSWPIRPWKSLLFCLLVPAVFLSMPGFLSAPHAEEADLYPDWPLFRIRQAAFRHVPLLIHITAIQPAHDPDSIANRRAIEDGRTTLPAREILASSAFGYSVLYDTPQHSADKKPFQKKAFYDQTGKTRAVALINTTGFPRKTAVYAYPSGRLEGVTFSLSPKDRFVFNAEGELCEQSNDDGYSRSRPDDPTLRSQKPDSDQDNRLWNRASNERKVAHITRKILDANGIRENIPCGVIDDGKTGLVNAYASLPEGKAYVTRSLLRYVENDDELAGIIGHELAHVLLRHWRPPQTGFEFFLGRGTYQDETERNFDREQRQEIEADARGVRLAMQAGYDPDAVFRMMQKILGDQNPDMPEKNTHPQATLRLKILKREIAALRKEYASRPQTTETVMVDASGKVRLGAWDEISARQEILKHQALAHTLPQEIRAFPAMDPEFLQKSAYPDRRLIAFQWVGDYAELMKSIGRETDGYSVLFSQSKAYPTYRPDGTLQSLTVCSQTDFPRVCHTAFVPDGQLHWSTLEISPRVAFFFNAQGKWLGYSQDNRRYDQHRRLIAIFDIPVRVFNEGTLPLRQNGNAQIYQAF